MKGRAESTRSPGNQQVSQRNVSQVHEDEAAGFFLADYGICLPAVHQNYVGTDAEKSPFYLSVVLSDQNNQRVPQYRAILWRKTVSSGFFKMNVDITIGTLLLG